MRLKRRNAITNTEVQYDKHSNELCTLQENAGYFSEGHILLEEFVYIFCPFTTTK